MSQKIYCEGCERWVWPDEMMMVAGSMPVKFHCEKCAATASDVPLADDPATRLFGGDRAND